MRKAKAHVAAKATRLELTYRAEEKQNAKQERKFNARSRREVLNSPRASFCSIEEEETELLLFYIFLHELKILNN